LEGERSIRKMKEVKRERLGGRGERETKDDG